jgi:hypothetical protein
MAMNAPTSNSWIIVSKKSGQPILETFNKQFADAVNRERYEVLTSLEWLQRFNKQVKENGKAINN